MVYIYQLEVFRRKKWVWLAQATLSRNIPPWSHATARILFLKTALKAAWRPCCYWLPNPRQGKGWEQEEGEEPGTAPPAPQNFPGPALGTYSAVPSLAPRSYQGAHQLAGPPNGKPISPSWKVAKTVQASFRRCSQENNLPGQENSKWKKTSGRTRSVSARRRRHSHHCVDEDQGKEHPPPLISTSEGSWEREGIWLWHTHRNEFC